MQQTALLETMRRHIAVVHLHDGITTEDGIAMMTFLIHGIHTIGMVRPEFIGQELVLRRGRIGRMALRMLHVLALNLLQEHDIGIQRAQLFAHLV
jgi:hypothetical protein